MTRGFARMTAERQREISSMGGAAVAPANRSFSQDRTLASSAGIKGGRSVKGENRSFSTNRELASAAGKLGGLARAKLNKARE
jgi:general stress protein YciG